MKNLLATSFLLLFGGFTFGQSAVVASGGEASGSGGTVSYTVGQVSYSTVQGSGGIMTEGVQQPYEIYIVTGIEDAGSVSLSISAYPNPTTDFLILNTSEYAGKNLAYQLYDMSGKLIETRSLRNGRTTIDMSLLQPSVYTVRVTENGKEIKVFKVVKH